MLGSTLLGLLFQVALGQTTGDSVSDAFIYALPAGEFMKTKMRLYYKYPDSYNGFAINQPLMPDETFTAVVAPNVDTVYAAGIFDLAASPRLITVPPVLDGRYVVTDFVDPYGNAPFAFNSIDIPQGGDYLIYGPSTSEKDATTFGVQYNATVIKFNTSDAMVLLRARHNATDPQQAAALLSSYNATRLLPGTDVPRLQRFNEIATQMTEFGLEFPDVGLLATQYENSIRNATIGWKWAMMGLKYVEPSTVADTEYVQKFQNVIDQAQNNATYLLEIASRVPAIVQTISAGTRQIGTLFSTGWSATNSPVVGKFGDNYLARAAVAFVLYLGLAPSQAVYFQTTIDPSTGKAYNGSHNYEVTFVSNQLPPVEGFWSMTVYYGVGDDSYGYLVGNPIERFSIGDRTPGLIYNSDGSLTVTLSATRPNTTAGAANWLPVGANRTFEVFLRAYGPTAGIADFAPPQIKLISK
ncbi:hypothetical protein HK103_000825 [Boothiomyces macroporosus]|uniref:DUF1254 domain-containing protein n=1 Tax=Boothiomyces macroporosus TaxID=261099 RepID=A0AAD5UB22_9FUNG|nr:hypothetical protein HK103_000825 [Boothiomyces macroporosus]